MQINDLEIILKIAEYKSITAAATSLDMQPATASAALKRIEKDLGVELFTRTTRQLRISSAGEYFLPKCQAALNQLNQATQAIQQGTDTLLGELKISISSDLGRNSFSFWLEEFLDQHTNLSVKLYLNDNTVDFYRDSIDLAFRYGSPKDARLIGFKLCDVPRFICASPEYLDKHSPIEHPRDLKKHNGLFYELNGIIHNTWEIQKGNQQHKIKMRGNRATNDGDQVRRWCIAGKGVAIKSGIDVAEDLINGNLIHLLNSYTILPGELWLVLPNRQSVTPAIRLLRDLIQQKCRDRIQRLINAGFLPKDFIHSLN